MSPNLPQKHADWNVKLACGRTGASPFIAFDEMAIATWHRKSSQGTNFYNYPLSYTVTNTGKVVGPMTNSLALCLQNSIVNVHPYLKCVFRKRSRLNSVFLSHAAQSSGLCTDVCRGIRCTSPGPGGAQGSGEVVQPPPGSDSVWSALVCPHPRYSKDPSVLPTGVWNP